jgi:nitrate reductase NapE
MTDAPTEDPQAIARRELRVFLFLTVVLAPVLAVGVVAAYGFIVWMAQLLIFGPPAG